MTLNIKHTPEEAWLAGDRIDIFSIDHETEQVDPETGKPILEQVWYSMPEKPNAGFALKYLKAARTMGAEVANAWLFELAIGSDAYDALSSEPDITLETLNTLMETVQRRVLGGLEAPKD